ncbi:MAG: hypothetical protein OEM05_14460 [Myxococcales bacterium]|nr:hypothetical protein [Myxococcales bacterium]
MRPSHSRTTLATLALAAALALAPAPARAEEEESLLYTGVVGVGSVVCTLVYSPLKVVYAASGLVVSGLAWMWTLGNTDVAGPIFTAAVGGDYVLMPAHLEGKQDLHFTGR